MISNKESQRMTIIVGLTFSVGDTTPQFTISIEEYSQSWWH